MVAAVDALKLVGPTLGRPLVDRLKGSAIHNLKELRPRGGGKNIRILFAFDPNRAAVLPLGGEVAGQWDSWYKTAIPTLTCRFAFPAGKACQDRAKSVPSPSQVEPLTSGFGFRASPTRAGILQ